MSDVHSRQEDPGALKTKASRRGLGEHQGNSVMLSLRDFARVLGHSPKFRDHNGIGHLAVALHNVHYGTFRHTPAYGLELSCPISRYLANSHDRGEKSHLVGEFSYTWRMESGRCAKQTA